MSKEMGLPEDVAKYSSKAETSAEVNIFFISIGINLKMLEQGVP